MLCSRVPCASVAAHRSRRRRRHAHGRGCTGRNARSLRAGTRRQARGGRLCRRRRVPIPPDRRWTRGGRLRGARVSESIRGHTANVLSDFILPPPLPPPGQVNLFNCTPLVYEFCSKVLRDSFDPALLFEFDERGGGLDAVALPTPAGVVLVSRADADAHWGDIFVTDVTDPARRRGLSWADLDCMRLLYVAALKLHALGLLGHDNQPTPAALAETRAACPGFPREPRVRLRHRYDESPNSVDSSPSTMTPRTAALRGWPPADAVVRRLAETLPPFVTPPAAASAPPRAQNFDVARTIAARSAFPQSDTLAAPLNSGAPDSSVSMRNLERGSPTSHTPRSICVGTTQPFPFPISARSPAGTASPTAPPHECTPKSSPAATSTSDRSWPMPVSQPAHAASPLSMMGSSSVGHQSSYPMPYSGGLPRSLGIAAGDLDR